MKRLEELGISRAPWRLFLGKPFGDKLTRLIQAAPGAPCYTIGEVYEVPDAQIACASPKLYERLWQSTNFIEHTVQFVKNPDIANHLKKIALENRATLAEAAGEEVAE